MQFWFLFYLFFLIFWELRRPQSPHFPHKPQQRKRKRKRKEKEKGSSLFASSKAAMASKSQRNLIVVFLLSISVLSVTARPCKTFFISSYSFSVRQPSSIHSSSSSSGFVTVFTEIRQINPANLDAVLIEEEEIDDARLHRRPLRLPLLPFTSSSASYDLSSLRDRTKDILSVVVALLFGVGCGALTAATMYLAWSLFSNRSDYHSSSPFGDDSDEDDFSPKKIGYVKIPAADSVPAPVPAKETGV